MCEVIVKKERMSIGGYNVLITCAKTGKQIVTSNKYGMYCEDMCGEEDDKLAGEVLKSMFPLIEDVVFASSEVASRIVGAKNKPKHKNVGRRK